MRLSSSSSVMLEMVSDRSVLARRFFDCEKFWKMDRNDETAFFLCVGREFVLCVVWCSTGEGVSGVLGEGDSSASSGE